jgi:integrase
MAKRLTSLAVENIKPTNQRQEIADSGCRGLYLVVQPIPSGRKGWAVRYRYQGRSRKLTLDNIGTLAAARQAATTALHELAQGRDPALLKFASRDEARAAAAERDGDTVERFAAQFIERHGKKLRPATRRQVERILHNEVLPVWRGRSVHDIRRRDIIALVEGIAEDRPIAANRALAWLHRFFTWLCERDAIEANPCAGVKHPSEEVPRDRILTDDEIATLWTICAGSGDPMAVVVMMLLLTGQRRNEVAGMRWSEITGDVWTLPGARTKNKRTHTVPLSTQVLALIAAQPRLADSDFVFTFTGKVPVSHFDRTKREIDARMRPKTPWVFHDLRRSAASGMARIGVALPVIEKCLNHTSGSFKGIVRVYQQHDYAGEKRNALQRWADHVERLAKGEPDEKVVPLGGRRSRRGGAEALA